MVHFKLCSSGEGGTDGKDLPVCTCICMCGSAHDCGCMVDGSNAMAVLRVLHTCAGVFSHTIELQSGYIYIHVHVYTKAD